MDDVDIAGQRIQDELDHNIRKQLESAPPMVKGNPGDCEFCGYWSGRLVTGACAQCRDKYGLP